MCASTKVIQRLHAGDATVLHEILDAHGQSVAVQLRQRFSAVVRWEDVEDALSLGLYQLWCKRAEYDASRSSLRTWLYLLSRNALLDAIRSYRRRQGRSNVSNLLAVVTDKSDTHDHQSSHGEVSLDCEAHERLMQCAHSMSLADQAILWAFVHSENTKDWTASIANELGLSRASVRARKQRILAKFRSAFPDRLRAKSTRE